MQKFVFGIIALVLLCNSFLNAKMIDYGTRGEVYPIRDKNFQELYHERASRVSKRELYEMAMHSISKAFVVKNEDIRSCMKTQSRTYSPMVTIKKDIVMPFKSSMVLLKKGKYNILKRSKQALNNYFFFLDASNPLQVFMAKEYRNYAKNGQITFIVVNGDIRELQKNNITAYKGTRDILKLFDVKCTPTIAVEVRDAFSIQEYYLTGDSNLSVQKEEK